MTTIIPSLNQSLAQHRGNYGFDAPLVPIILGGTGLVALACSILCFTLLQTSTAGILCLIFALWILLSASSYLYTTRFGKFHVWASLLAQAKLRGDEQVLDLGCGRGMVLLMVARLLSTGQATGVDLWITKDQSGNADEATRRNAEIEGVSERVTLQTADMRKLPFADASFDLVLSSLAIHNIGDPDGRDQVLDEAKRVLKPGGRLLIADIGATSRYAEHLQELGLENVTRRSLGWRFWYGGPWMPTNLVSASKAR